MKEKIVFIMTMIVVLVAVSAHAAQVIKVDGSSTVYPITEAIAEEFQTTLNELTTLFLFVNIPPKSASHHLMGGK